MNHSNWMGLALVAATFSGQATAADTTLTFSGLCITQNCRGIVADGTTPASVTATLTLSDLTWIARAGGGYEASSSNAFNFGYSGPDSVQPVGTVSVNRSKSYFYSSTPSIGGIYDFDILLGEPVGPAPALLYLSGNSSGWRWGGFSLFPIGGVLIPFRFDIHRSTILSQWSVSAVPEPASYGLMGFGVGTLIWLARRRKYGQANA
jgi:PEP-CTERM motif